MFYGAIAFNNGDSDGIKSWNVGQVTRFENMFRNAYAFNQPLEWNINTNTSANVNMSNMFNNAQVFNQDITQWNTSRVNNFSAMFYNASAFNQNLANWSMTRNGSHTNMLQGSGLDCENFSLTIIGWAQPSSATERNLGSVAPLYYAPWAVDKFTTLTSAGQGNLNWTITGMTLGDPGTIQVNGITNALSLCAGNNETIVSTVTGGTWSSDNSLVATVTPGANPLLPGTLNSLAEGVTYIKYTIPGQYGGCYSRYEVTVTNLNIDIEATSNSPVCEGSDIQLQIANNINIDSYEWTGPNGYTDNSQIATIVGAVPNQSGAYTAKIISGGCSKDTTFQVDVVNVPAQPGNISGNLSVCSSSTESYSIAPVTHATSYNWSYTGSGFPEQTTNAVSFAPGSSGTLSVEAVNDCGTSLPTTLAVSVTQAPSAGLIAGKTQFCFGDVDFLYTTSSTSGTWTSSNESIVSIDANSGKIDAKQVSNTPVTITYTVAPNGPCPGDATTFQVTVVPVPVVNVTLSGNTFSVATETGTSYQWISCLSYSDNEILGATTANFLAPTPGIYAVVATNSNGCQATSDCKTYNYGSIDNGTSIDMDSIQNYLDSLNNAIDSLNNQIGKLGVDDNQIELISMAPNPAVDAVFIGGLTSPAVITIMDANGKVMLIEQTNASYVELSINSLARGMYFVHIESPTAVGTKKLIKT